MRISDWSSDVCSSDLSPRRSDIGGQAGPRSAPTRAVRTVGRRGVCCEAGRAGAAAERLVSDILGKQSLHALRCRRDGNDNHGQAGLVRPTAIGGDARSEEHKSELQSLMRISDDVICSKKQNNNPRIAVHTKIEQLTYSQPS